MKEHKKCYGKIFHDTLYFGIHEEAKGKVFSFEIDCVGLG